MDGAGSIDVGQNLILSIFHLRLEAYRSWESHNLLNKSTVQFNLAVPSPTNNSCGIRGDIDVSAITAVLRSSDCSLVLAVSAENMSNESDDSVVGTESSISGEDNSNGSITDRMGGETQQTVGGKPLEHMEPLSTGEDVAIDDKFRSTASFEQDFLGDGTNSVGSDISSDFLDGRNDDTIDGQDGFEPSGHVTLTIGFRVPRVVFTIANDTDLGICEVLAVRCRSIETLAHTTKEEAQYFQTRIFGFQVVNLLQSAVDEPPAFPALVQPCEVEKRNELLPNTDAGTPVRGTDEKETIGEEQAGPPITVLIRRQYQEPVPLDCGSMSEPRKTPVAATIRVVVQQLSFHPLQRPLEELSSFLRQCAPPTPVKGIDLSVSNRNVESSSLENNTTRIVIVARQTRLVLASNEEDLHTSAVVLQW